MKKHHKIILDRLKKNLDKNGISPGFICGGVISESELKKGQKKHGVWFAAMSYVMIDYRYKQYVAAIKRGDKKRERYLFKRYAVSQI